MTTTDIIQCLVALALALLTLSSLIALKRMRDDNKIVTSKLDAIAQKIIDIKNR